MQLKLINIPTEKPRFLLLNSGDFFTAPKGVPYSVAQVQGLCIQADGTLSVNFDCYFKNGYNLFHEGKLYIQ